MVVHVSKVLLLLSLLSFLDMILSIFGNEKEPYRLGLKVSPLSMHLQKCPNESSIELVTYSTSMSLLFQVPPLRIAMRFRSASTLTPNVLS